MVENYISPACYVTEIELEGVLCLSDASVNATHGEFNLDQGEVW